MPRGDAERPTSAPFAANPCSGTIHPITESFGFGGDTPCRNFHKKFVGNPETCPRPYTETPSPLVRGGKNSFARPPRALAVSRIVRRCCPPALVGLWSSVGETLQDQGRPIGSSRSLAGKWGVSLARCSEGARIELHEKNWRYQSDTTRNGGGVSALLCLHHLEFAALFWQMKIRPQQRPQQCASTKGQKPS
jgi:hypothetical protein